MTDVIEMPRNYAAISMEEMQYLEGGVDRYVTETGTELVARLKKVKSITSYVSDVSTVISYFNHWVSVIASVAAEWFTNVNSHASTAYSTACNYVNKFGGNTTLKMTSSWNALALSSISVTMV